MKYIRYLTHSHNIDLHYLEVSSMQVPSPFPSAERLSIEKLLEDSEFMSQIRESVPPECDFSIESKLVRGRERPVNNKGYIKVTFLQKDPSHH